MISTIEGVGTAIFLVGLLHSVCGGLISHYLPARLRFITHPESAMVMWATVLLGVQWWGSGSTGVIKYVSRLHLIEPIYVATILIVCSTPSLIRSIRWTIFSVAHRLPVNTPMTFFVLAIVLGSLSGSIITEPAAMTLMCTIIGDTFLTSTRSDPFKYAVLGLILVSVSIGGALTPFSAPPIVMVATAWGWTLPVILRNFALPVIVSIVASTVIITMIFRRELTTPVAIVSRPRRPDWIVSTIAMTLLVATLIVRHSLPSLLAILLIATGVIMVTSRRVAIAAVESGVWVGLFLVGVIILGGLQTWWVAPIIRSLPPSQLFMASIVVSAVADNAALAYLGTLVPDICRIKQLAIVGGAVCGGGLTVIANAPNPIAFRLLAPAFGSNGINPVKLALAAVGPTLLVAALFWISQ